MKYIQVVLWGVIFFVAFFLKQITIGGLDLVYAWKLPLLLVLLTGVVGRKSGYVFITLAYVFAIKNLISSHVIIFPFDAVVNFIKYLTIPVFIHWILLNMRNINTLRVVRELPLYLSAFFILSNIPYYFGLFANSTKVLLWINEVGVKGFVGILGAAHYTSAVLAVSCLVLINFIVNKKGRENLKYLFVPIALLGLFFIYKTYVRTGWLMFIVGLIVLFSYKIKFKDIWKFVTIGFVLLIGFVYLLQSNDDFRRRIFDDRTGIENNSFMERAGSGRLKIAYVYLTNFAESNFTTIMIGMGMKESKREYGEKTGVELFAHNGFIETLVDNGILGFLIYLFFLFKMYFSISNLKSSNGRMARVLFFMFLSCLLTQQANYYLVDVFLAIYTGLALVENEINTYVERKRAVKEKQVAIN